MEDIFHADLPAGQGCEGCGSQLSLGRYRRGLCSRCHREWKTTMRE